MLNNFQLGPGTPQYYSSDLAGYLAILYPWFDGEKEGYLIKT